MIMNLLAHGQEFLEDSGSSNNVVKRSNVKIGVVVGGSHRVALHSRVGRGVSRDGWFAVCMNRCGSTGWQD